MGGAENLKERCAGKEAELPKPHVLLSPSSPAKNDKKFIFIQLVKQDSVNLS